MKVIQSFAFVVTFLPRSATSADLFNYRDTQGTDYGPQNWNRVQCPDLQSCVSMPVRNLLCLLQYSKGVNRANKTLYFSHFLAWLARQTFWFGWMGSY